MQFILTLASNKTCNDIKIKVKVDDCTVEEWSMLKGSKDILLDIQDTEVEKSRNISIEMSGKQAHHTVISDDNKILDDCYTCIEKIIFDEIDVTDIFCEGCMCYTHNNNNNSTEQILDEFYGFIGYNGIVNICFYTPLWHWFLSKCK